MDTPAESGLSLCNRCTCYLSTLRYTVKFNGLQIIANYRAETAIFNLNNRHINNTTIENWVQKILNIRENQEIKNTRY